MQHPTPSQLYYFGPLRSGDFIPIWKDTNPPATYQFLSQNVESGRLREYEEAARAYNEHLYATLGPTYLSVFTLVSLASFGFGAKSLWDVIKKKKPKYLMTVLPIGLIGIMSRKNWPGGLYDYEKWLIGWSPKHIFYYIWVIGLGLYLIATGVKLSR